MDVMELAAKIILETDEYERGLERAGAKAEKFTEAESKAAKGANKLSGSLSDAIGNESAYITGAAVLAGTASLARWFYKESEAAAEFGDTIDKNSQKIGISASAYQKWDFVLQRNGASISTMRTAMRTLTNQAEKNNSAFAKLGINLKEIRTMPQEKLFENVISGLQGITDQQERATLANTLLGRSYQELNPLLNATKEETQELFFEYHRLGAEMTALQIAQTTAFKDAKTNLSTATQGLKNNLGTIFIEPFTAMINSFAYSIGSFNNRIGSTTKGKTVEQLTEDLEKYQAMYDEVFNNPDYIGDAANAMAYYSSKIEEAQAAIEIAKKAQDDFNQSMRDSGIGDFAQNYIEVWDSIAKSVNRYFKPFQEAERAQTVSIDNMIKNIQSQNQFFESYNDNLKTAEEYFRSNGIDFQNFSEAIASLGVSGAGYLQGVIDAINSGDTEKVAQLAGELEKLGSLKLNNIEALTSSITNLQGQIASGIGDINNYIAAFDSANRPDIVNTITTVYRTVYENGGGGSGSENGAAGGIDYVRKHNTLVLLHEGERVMTKSENQKYMNGENGSGKTYNITQNIQSVPQTEADLAAAIMAALERIV